MDVTLTKVKKGLIFRNVFLQVMTLSNKVLHYSYFTIDFFSQCEVFRSDFFFLSLFVPEQNLARWFLLPNFDSLVKGSRCDGI